MYATINNIQKKIILKFQGQLDKIKFFKFLHEHPLNFCKWFFIQFRYTTILINRYFQIQSLNQILDRFVKMVFNIQIGTGMRNTYCPDYIELNAVQNSVKVLKRHYQINKKLAMELAQFLHLKKCFLKSKFGDLILGQVLYRQYKICRKCFHML